MGNSIKLISVVGPTASGKTRLAIELAKRYNGEIISADSMQIYQGMKIATAKPDEQEMDGIKHHLIDFLPPDKTYSVAMFVRDAKSCIEDINSRGKLPIIAGGTGLYVDSLLNNVSFNEEQRDEKLSAQLYSIYEAEGIEPLLNMLKGFDEDSYNRLLQERNPKRIIRAIEFYKTTGITITQHNKNSMLEKSPYSVIKLGLNAKDREYIYKRINMRVNKMLDDGLLKEAEEVIKGELSFTSIKAIGYKELMPYFNNAKPLDECIEKLKMETRRYAKRQLTWFRRDTDINWLYIDDYSSFDELFYDAISIVERGL